MRKISSKRIKFNKKNPAEYYKMVNIANMDSGERAQFMLGEGAHKTDKKYVCFLPYFGEFGWMIMTYCKRFHGYKHDNKIVFTKPGHECLYPSAKGFIYDWQDIPDNRKAGINTDNREEEYKKLFIEKYGDNVHFVSPNEASWEEKISLGYIRYIPENKKDFDLEVDIVITPRHREMDAQRNWPQDYWQSIVNDLVAQGYNVGVCGARGTTYDLENVKYKSYNYLDVDSDVELMRKAKLVITQESGLLYLAFLCEKPIIVIDHYHSEHGSNVHKNSPLIEAKDAVWSNPHALLAIVKKFLNQLGK